MAEARDVSVNREFIVSGFLSGQAYRLAVRVDSTAARLIRLGLRDFDKAKALEADVFAALSDLDATTKSVRKMIDKVNRRRREGVPSAGPKQNFMVRSLPSAHAFRCAVAVDQIQRDISMLGLASSGDVAKTAAEAQTVLAEAINIADSIMLSVMKKTDSRRPAGKSSQRGKTDNSKDKSSQSGMTGNAAAKPANQKPDAGKPKALPVKNAAPNKKAEAPLKTPPKTNEQRASSPDKKSEKANVAQKDSKSAASA